MLKKILFILFLLPVFSLTGALVLVDGKFSDKKYAPTLSPSEHFNAGYALLGEKKWSEAHIHFRTVVIHFEDTPYYSDALFYSGVCNYFLNDLDLANQLFSSYLAKAQNPYHFEKAFEFKYYIAQGFAKGAKKHLFGNPIFPSLLPAKNDALALYDEVIASLPSESLAATALYAKADLLRNTSKKRESIEVLNTLVRRFPKHPLAMESYLVIGDIYLEEITAEPQNPDLISLAKINRERFQKNFPGDDRVAHFDQNLRKMEELFSESLYEVGRYYERKGKPKASALYYKETMNRYPETQASKNADERLSLLDINVAK